MWSLLEKKGIRKKDLVEAALALYCPHPGVENRKKAKGILEESLERVFLDPNINALVIAGFYLDDAGEKGAIPRLKKNSFKKDPVFLVSDEILGMAIAEYIGGTKARFEYVRFDKEKPGILKKLGPFSDDVICGIVAGVSSKMYSDYC